MKTLDFDTEISNSDFQRPDMHKVGREYVYNGFVVFKIEEFNMVDKILNTVSRSYRIYWENKDGIIKYFDCGLNTDTYRRFIVPNIGKCKLMRP